MKRVTLVLALLLALSGCETAKGVIDSDLAQLERFKQAAEAGDHGAIAAETIDCAPPAEEVCRQLHLIKADACFALARAGEAPAANFECAIAEIAEGLDPAPDVDTALGPNRAFAETRLEALRERQDQSRSRAEAALFTTELIDRARAYRNAWFGDPAGAYYEASGRLTLVGDGFATGAPEAALCSELEALGGLVRQARDEPGRYAATLAQITRDIDGLAQAECTP